MSARGRGFGYSRHRDTSASLSAVTRRGRAIRRTSAADALYGFPAARLGRAEHCVDDAHAPNSIL